MIDTTLLFADKANRTYHILGKPGDFRYERVEGEFTAPRYIFSRPHAKNPNKRVEVVVTRNTLQSKVFEVTARMTQPQDLRIDLGKLEAFTEYPSENFL